MWNGEAANTVHPLVPTILFPNTKHAFFYPQERFLPLSHNSFILLYHQLRPITVQQCTFRIRKDMVLPEKGQIFIDKFFCDFRKSFHPLKN